MKILDLALAENFISISGLEPCRAIPIVFTGLRPGMKMHEELMGAFEGAVKTSSPKTRVVHTEESNLASLESGPDRLAASSSLNDADGVNEMLCELIPECVPPLREPRDVTQVQIRTT